MVNSTLSKFQQNELQELIYRFGKVFEDIKGLPPIRYTAHPIVLQQGVGPVSVKPYGSIHNIKKMKLKDILITFCNKGLSRIAPVLFPVR